jgi:hypothetical protein
MPFISTIYSIKSGMMLSIILPPYLENFGELLSKICLPDILIYPCNNRGYHPVIFPASTFFSQATLYPSYDLQTTVLIGTSAIQILHNIMQ